jgi:putative glycosyltransferase (TIGR04372 family)
VALPSVGPERNKIVNAYAYQYIGMPGLDDVMFWLYVIREHQAEVDLSDIEWYMKRRHFDNIFIKAYSVKPHFTEDEVREGEKRLREMGVNGKFVSMAARTSQYNSRTLIDGWDESFYDYRNADFQDYRDTIDYLSTIRLQAVKAGSYEDVMNPIDNCIDYAGRFSTDFMDLFLSSRCEFMITGESGIFCLAQLFAKPVLMVNMTPISWGVGGGMRYTEYDMYLPKKLYDKKKKRYLTFKEIYALEQECRIDTFFYEENDLEIVNNSSQEILEATQEMIARMEGTWVDTEEDKKNYAKYEKLHNEMKDKQIRNPRNWIGRQLPYRLATTFLRKNLFMLNDEE